MGSQEVSRAQFDALEKRVKKLEDEKRRAEMAHNPPPPTGQIAGGKPKIRIGKLKPPGAV